MSRNGMHAELSEEGRGDASSLSPLPKPGVKRVQLHIHLDGAIRAETLFDLSQKRNIPLPQGLDTLEKLESYFDSIAHVQCLTKFLHAFSVIIPVIAGDEEAIHRIAYEFCEDCAKQNICYTEVRYSPFILANCYDDLDHEVTPGHMTAEHVVQVINKAFKEGERDFSVKVRTLLCAMRHRPDWSEHTLHLATKYSSEGVIGIDLAGDENMTEIEPTHIEHKKLFAEAKRLNIHRTVHAGENGTAENVREAVEDLYAERVGHGYHILDDEKLYQEFKERNIHFETCPHSSVVTGSVDKDWATHPVKRFAEDGANFSINTDDPTLTKTTLEDEYEICRRHIKLSERQLWEANMNAARSCFLPEDEKENLLKELRESCAASLK